MKSNNQINPEANAKTNHKRDFPQVRGRSDFFHSLPSYLIIVGSFLILKELSNDCDRISKSPHQIPHVHCVGHEIVRKTVGRAADYLSGIASQSAASLRYNAVQIRDSLAWKYNTITSQFHLW